MINRRSFPPIFPLPTTHSQQPHPHRLHPLARGALDRAPPSFQRHARCAAPRAGAPRLAVVGPDELGHLFEQGGRWGWCQGGGGEARPGSPARGREPARRRLRVKGSAHCGVGCVPAGVWRVAHAHARATPAPVAVVGVEKNGQPTVSFFRSATHSSKKPTLPFCLSSRAPPPTATPPSAHQCRQCARALGALGEDVGSACVEPEWESSGCLFRGLAFDTSPPPPLPTLNRLAAVAPWRRPVLPPRAPSRIGRGECGVAWTCCGGAVVAAQGGAARVCASRVDGCHAAAAGGPGQGETSALCVGWRRALGWEKEEAGGQAAPTQQTTRRLSSPSLHTPSHRPSSRRPAPPPLHPVGRHRPCHHH